MTTGVFGKLKGLGPKSSQVLVLAGIHDVEQLRTLGSIRAFLKVCRCNPGAENLNLLYAIEGALSDPDWRDVARHEKDRLLIELDAARQWQRN